MKHKKIVLLLFLPFLFSACSNRNLVYFSDLPKKSQYVSNTLQVPEPVIQAGDILSIKVNSMSAESNAIFNSGGISTAADRSETGYLVDKAGEISFPIVGKIKLAGLTTQQAREKMTKEVLRYVKDPIVNLKLLNFKVTVIGEVARPSTFILSFGSIVPSIIFAPIKL